MSIKQKGHVNEMLQLIVTEHYKGIRALIFQNHKPTPVNNTNIII